jgi:hypothetical protein
MCIGFSQGVTLFSYKEKRIITFQFIQYGSKSESDVFPLTTLDVQVSKNAVATCPRMQRKEWVLSDRDALSKIKHISILRYKFGKIKLPYLYGYRGGVSKA